MPRSRPANYGKHYQDWEIALIYLFARSDRAKAFLANMLERTPDAIDLVWRWMEGAKFPPGAFNKIKRQFEAMVQELGPERRGIVHLE